MPKTSDTRRHCEVELTVCNNLPQPLSLFGGCGRLLHTVNSTSQCLLVSLVFGTVSSLHPTSFLMIFILVYIGMVNVYCAKKERKMVGVVDYYARL